MSDRPETSESDAMRDEYDFTVAVRGKDAARSLREPTSSRWTRTWPWCSSTRRRWTRLCDFWRNSPA